MSEIPNVHVSIQCGKGPDRGMTFRKVDTRTIATAIRDELWHMMRAGWEPQEPVITVGPNKVPVDWQAVQERVWG